MRAAVLALALAASGAEAEERVLLEALCEAAVQFWTGRLGEGVSVEDCGGVFSCAAALTAAADLASCRQSGPAAFTAGEVTIRERGAAEAAAQAESLHRAAERLMAPYAVEGGFAFRGVRG